MVKFKLAQLRKRNHLTQQELGEILCVSYQTISKWENGELYDIGQSKGYGPGQNSWIL